MTAPLSFSHLLGGHAPSAAHTTGAVAPARPTPGATATPAASGADTGFLRALQGRARPQAAAPAGPAPGPAPDSTDRTGGTEAAPSDAAATGTTPATTGAVAEAAPPAQDTPPSPGALAGDASALLPWPVVPNPLTLPPAEPAAPSGSADDSAQAQASPREAGTTPAAMPGLLAGLQGWDTALAAQAAGNPAANNGLNPAVPPAWSPSQGRGAAEALAPGAASTSPAGTATRELLSALSHASTPAMHQTLNPGQAAALQRAFREAPGQTPSRETPSAAHDATTAPARSDAGGREPWPEASRLGPEAAALRERSGAGTPATGAGLELAALAASTEGRTGAAGPSATEATGASRSPAAQALLGLLGERIETQWHRSGERTVIRLEPPLQGQLEITLHRSAAGLQVQLSASHGEVLKQLQALSEGLRQELAGRHAGEVSVQVAQQGARDGEGRGRQTGDEGRPAQTPGRALNEDESAERPARFALPGSATAASTPHRSTSPLAS